MNQETRILKMADQELLSEDDYINLLKLRFNNPAIKFEKAEFESLTEKLEGFMGEHNNLKILYSLNGESATVNFFVKSKPRLQSSADVADKLLVYEKEVFFYDVLMREFENRGYNTSFAPKAYLCKNNTTLVMNDLKSEGFYSSGRTNFYDLEKTRSSLKALAYYHGASLIYEEEKSEELNRSFRLGVEYPDILKEKFMVFDDKQNIGYNYFHSSITCFVKLIELFQEKDEWKQQFQQLLKNLNFLEMFSCDLGTRKALGHGDLWSNNMLFKQQNGELQCCIFDYQVLRYLNPAFDAIYLIFTNMRKKLRDVHTDTLLDYYYDCLKEVLNQRNLDIENIYPKQDFMKSIKYKFLARFQSACAHTLTFADVNKLKLILGERSLEQLIKDDRASFVVEAFKYDNFFAEIMKENLYEIKDMLSSINVN